MSSRDAAQSFRFEGGTGALLELVPLRSQLVGVKTDMLFYLELPDVVDPERTNPTLPHTIRKEPVGAAHEVVARLLVQSNRMLNRAAISRSVDRAAVMQQVHETMTLLLSMREVASRLIDEIAQMEARVLSGGVTVTGNVVGDFPSVPDLRGRVTRWLTTSKRAIVSIVAISESLLQLGMRGHHFKKAAEIAKGTLGVDAPLVRYFEQQFPVISDLVELRNSQEHPNADKFTVIKDFELHPTGAAMPPLLHLSTGPAMALASVLRQVEPYLLDVAEATFVHALMSIVDKRAGHTIDRIAAIDPACPVKLELGFNFMGIRR